MDFLNRLSLNGKSLLIIIHDFLTSLAIPDAVTGQNQELDIFVEWLYYHVRI